MTRHPAAVPDSGLLTTQEACAHIRRSRWWLAQHKHEIGVVIERDRNLYRRADLDRYLARGYVAPADETPAPPERTMLPFPTAPLSAEALERRAKRLAQAERAIARAQGVRS